MRAEAGLVEELECRRHRVVVRLGVLVQDDVALALELHLRKGALAHDVAEHRDEARRVAGQTAHVERRVIAVGVGVDLGAQPLGIEVDPLAVARVRPLERHVLDEVADAVEGGALVLAAAAHEDADGGGGEMRQPEDEDAHAVVQRGDHGVRIAGRAGAQHEAIHVDARILRLATIAATSAVHPDWCEAPSPSPVSP